MADAHSNRLLCSAACACERLQIDLNVSSPSTAPVVDLVRRSELINGIDAVRCHTPALSVALQSASQSKDDYDN